MSVALTGVYAAYFAVLTIILLVLAMAGLPSWADYAIATWLGANVGVVATGIVEHVR